MLRKGGVPEKGIPFNFLLKRFVQVGKEMIASGNIGNKKREKRERKEREKRVRKEREKR